MKLLALLLATSTLLLAQDAKRQPPAAPKPPVAHSSPDFRKCRKCLPAYEAALAYVRKRLGESTVPVKMISAWLFLADGRYPSDLEHCVKAALQWESQRRGSQHAQNWYPALAGMFLVEYYKFFPTPEVAKGLPDIIAEFVKTQER